MIRSLSDRGRGRLDRNPSRVDQVQATALPANQPVTCMFGARIDTQYCPVRLSGQYYSSSIDLIRYIEVGPDPLHILQVVQDIQKLERRLCVFLPSNDW